MKKTTLVAISIAFYFLLICCTDQTEKGTVHTDKTLDYLKKTADEFRAEQEKKWAAVQAYYKENPQFLDTMKFDTTRPIDQRIAQYYISEFLARNPATDIRTVGGQSKEIKRTESVWIDKKAILSLLYTLLTEADLDGVRLYFAQYPINASTLDASLTDLANGRKTVIFTATKKEKTDHFITSGTGTRTDGLYIYDYNSLCPDICDGGTLGGH